MTAIALPHIRLPRPREIIRPSLAWLMASLKKGAGGHLVKNAAGHLVKECEPDPVLIADCGDCTGDTTHLQYQLVFSSVTLNTTCRHDGLSTYYKKNAGSTFSGTFTVDDFDPSGPCHWLYSAAYSTHVVNQHFHSSCADAPSNATNWINVSLSRQPNVGTDRWSVSVQLFDGVSGLMPIIQVFSGELNPSSTDCSTPVTVTNNLIGSTYQDLGSGGSVEVTPV